VRGPKEPLGTRPWRFLIVGGSYDVTLFVSISDRVESKRLEPNRLRRVVLAPRATRQRSDESENSAKHCGVNYLAAGAGQRAALVHRHCHSWV
jgi:hypothetical protein